MPRGPSFIVALLRREASYISSILQATEYYVTFQLFLRMSFSLRV